MKVITIDGGFVNSLPTSAEKPGRFTGFTRDGVMSRVFELATEYGHDMRVKGQKWPVKGNRASIVRMASDKLSKGMR